MTRHGGLAIAALLAAALPLCGCIAVSSYSSATLTCPAGQERQLVADVVLARFIGQTLGVSDADFTRFLDEEVNPRFPDGYSIYEGKGRWLYKGVVYNEPHWRLNIILPGRPDDQRKLGEIAAAYEDRFHQDAVLSMVAPACISFWYPKDRAK